MAGEEPKGRRAAEAAGEETVAKAQARALAVAEAATALRGRIESMDSELDRLTETLRFAGAKLATQLAAIERDAKAFDAAMSAHASGAEGPSETSGAAAGLGGAAGREAREREVESAEPTSAEESADLEGARLIALNMALNGDSREATTRYLAQHFDLPQREALVDEIYAAVEG